jgi:predicted alpha/beta superfamily hydrolase
MRGSAVRVRSAEGAEFMRIRNALTLFILCLGTPPVLGQAAPCSSTATGDLHFHQLSSKIFNNTRTIRVLLPQGYNAPANSERRYPVLYMLDGQNLFDACLSEVSHKEWQVDETMYRLIGEKAIPEMIVVGIDHAGPKRAHEFLPYKDYASNAEMEDPAGKHFPDFLTDEVMPLVDQRYRTLKGHPNTGIGGSSYGGVASLYALMAKPGTFGYGLIESPTMWIGMGQLVRDTHPLIAMPQKVFIAFGGKEGDNEASVQKMISLIRMVQANFREAGYDDSSFRFIVDPEAKHDEPAWAKRFPDAMKFLFADWKSQQ